MKKTYQRILYLTLTAFLLAGFIFSAPKPAFASNPDQMEVHFIDVGQGDATLVTCGGHAMLIDAGDDTRGTAIQNYLQKQKITRLDYLILTHPDADHIGGAPVIITKFAVDNVFVSNYEKDNKTYLKLIQSLDNKRLKASTPKVNSNYTLGSASITILAPGKEYDNPNDASIALLLKNGTRSFLFTGDAGEAAEKDILKTGVDVSADVYKIGHHGSRYSTSADFFAAVNPFYAVISCGADNAYGHPHAETLNTLRTAGVKVYRTDEAGTIIASTDGRSISFNVPASESWKAGEPAGGHASSSATQSPKTAPAAQQRDSAAAIEKRTQESAPAIEEKPLESTPDVTYELTYILNTKTKKFHRPSCNSLPTKNRQDSSESRESIISQGYAPCKRCNP